MFWNTAVLDVRWQGHYSSPNVKNYTESVDSLVFNEYLCFQVTNTVSGCFRSARAVDSMT